MTTQVEVLLPIGETPQQQKAELAPRLENLQGRTIAVFSNSWQCMVTMADELASLLTGPRYGAREVICFASPLTQPMPQASMRDAIARCDAAIVGLGT